jgi:hypothetical protein
MFTSSADVFRIRQATGDLLAYARSVPDATKSRLAAGFPSGGGAGSLTALLGRDGRFQMPEEEAIHSAVQLAASLPDDDFPVFTLATALILADALLRSEADDQFWSWEAFHDQYALADAPVRAALVNGFRALSAARTVRFDPPIDPALAFSHDRDDVLAALDLAGRDALTRAILADFPASIIGTLWHEATAPNPVDLLAFRYFYEREAGIDPPDPTSARLIPWP